MTYDEWKLSPPQERRVEPEREEEKRLYEECEVCHGLGYLIYGMRKLECPYCHGEGRVRK